MNLKAIALELQQAIIDDHDLNIVLLQNPLRLSIPTKGLIIEISVEMVFAYSMSGGVTKKILNCGPLEKVGLPVFQIKTTDRFITKRTISETLDELRQIFDAGLTIMQRDEIQEKLL